MWEQVPWSAVPLHPSGSTTEGRKRGKAGATAVRGGPGFSPTRGPAFRQHPVVEVAGIEPASFGALPGLLRAQFALPLLGPTDHANKSV